MEQYLGANFVIDCAEQNISVCGVIHSVRPKTFQLLVALIKQSGQVVTKQALLASIWDDVHVEEHVIVQSIAELRKVFDGLTVIKTFPRKGYCWVAAVETRQITLPSLLGLSQKSAPETLTPETSTAESTTPESAMGVSANDNAKAFRFLLASVFIVSLVLAALLVLIENAKGEDKNETVFILPTVNRMMDSKFDWVSLGIMDTVISQARDHKRIMPLDYVLSSMRLANMEREYNEAQIARLVQITGASTVISSELSRRLGEFQLVYQIHQHNGIKRGVILDSSLDELISQFAEVTGVAAQGSSSQVNIVNSAFNHELFVEAIAQSRLGKQDSAVMLLKSLISLEPNNIEAYLTLVDWLQYQGDYQQALRFSAKALSLLEDDEPEKASFYYRHGYSLYRLNDLYQAMTFANELKRALRNNRNPLYSGFSFQLEGELSFAMQDYESANQAFERALNDFSSVGHSIGMTTVHILIANTYTKLGDQTGRLRHLGIARGIVEKYQLEDLLTSFKIELPQQ